MVLESYTLGFASKLIHARARTHTHTHTFYLCDLGFQFKVVT